MLSLTHQPSTYFKTAATPVDGSNNLTLTLPLSAASTALLCHLLTRTAPPNDAAPGAPLADLVSLARWLRHHRLARPTTTLVQHAEAWVGTGRLAFRDAFVLGAVVDDVECCVLALSLAEKAGGTTACDLLQIHRWGAQVETWNYLPEAYALALTRALAATTGRAQVFRTELMKTRSWSWGLW